MTPGEARPPGSLIGPIRLRTLVLLRWVALGGQLCAIVAALWLGLRFQLGLVLAVTAAGAVFNLALMRRGAQPDSAQAALQLAFDVVQVSLLLALTGGLSNPFALLILAPVTIAATALDRQKVVILGLATVAMVTLASFAAQPLRDSAGLVIESPPLLVVGHWVAVVIAVVFFAGYAHRVSTELRARSSALAATEMALAREQRLQNLGGVVAAAAHEMGTPLATIKLVASELADELEDREDLASDLALLRDSADRCRDILRSMGRAGKDDMMLRATPLHVLIAEAAEPHATRGDIRVTLDGAEDSPEPVMQRDPGTIHGLRNLIQNAVDFAAETVRIEARWSADRVIVTVADDGAGFPPALLARIGEPFLTTRRPAADRPGYEGMGLGLFIAKSLLERSGATLRFGNGAGGGAEVEVSWPRGRIEAKARGPLGENPAIA
nr:ActS/PrrB/RegB family redox-sensitive histidine kinase [Paracoccus sp. S-4012]